MWYLYLDESGDLGFDFFSKKPSNFFTVCILRIDGSSSNREVLNAVKKTIRRKLPAREGAELKGSHTSIAVKRYFYRLVNGTPFTIYALSLNKRRVYDQLRSRKDRVYNFIARCVLDRIPLEQANTRVEFIIDRCKNHKGIAEFNEYIIGQLKSRIEPSVPLDIYHHSSHENLGLQAADLFSWGIFRSYERKDGAWKAVFKSKVACDEIYLK